MKYYLRLLFLSFLLTTSIFTVAQSKDETAITQLMQVQENDWNIGNLEGFMKGYWEDDSLMFIGKSGITYGWQNTLDNYKRNYPDKAAMGILTFTLLEMKPILPNNYFVAGRWHLKRTIGDLEGHFTLLFKKINNEWVIIADHSS